MVVFTGAGEVAYDEVFHHGINIITGDNSSGKSTITHLIFYVLGGSFNDWVKEAKQCSIVYAEAQMNNVTLTLSREIIINPDTQKGNASESINIFWGDYSTAFAAPISEWQRFPFNTTPGKKSFSNVFFENLNIPVVKGESNITFHQLLRLLYVDQDSPTSSLFLYEQFDTTLTRETVADLLLGVYNQDLYDSKQRLIEVNNELDDTKKEIRVIRQFVPNELNLFPSHLITQIENQEAEIAVIEDELIKLKEHQKTVRYLASTKLEFEKLNVEMIAQRESVQKLESDISSLEFEIDDSKYFIDSLENKIKAIRNSTITREFLGDFPLEYCPECLSDLTKATSETSCKLCKETIDSSHGISKAKRIEQELSFQVRESKNLLEKRKAELATMEATFTAEKLKLHGLQIRVNTALKDVKTVRDEKIDSLYVDKGYKEGEITQLRTLLEHAERYQALIQKRTTLEQEQSFLEASVIRMTKEQANAKIAINNAIEKEALYLLNHDLDRQEDFMTANTFTIDYRNNLAFIADKNAKYSASSNFYLKTTARYAIFLASLQNNRMRYPRFILCDNMEDKGIEAERAKNFQRIIIAEAEKQPNDSYQLIYTTSFIADELKGSEYIVGDYYTKANPSLKNVTSI